MESNVFVLANHSPERMFVRWYLSHEQADRLFENAIASGNEEEDVFLFELHVQDVTNSDEVRQKAEDAVATEKFTAIRSFSPKTR